LLHIVQSDSKTKQLTLISLFAVLYTVLRIVPTFPMIGVSGTFSASDVLAPLYGIILGPYVGGAGIIVGTFLAFTLGRPIVFLGLDFLPATVGAIALGLLSQRRFRPVAAVFIMLLILFLVNPLTLLFVPLNGAPLPFNWLHFVALIVLISPVSRRAVDWIMAPSPRRLVLGLSILCFIGTMMQHITGGLLFESIFGLVLNTISVDAWPGVWSTVFYVYPFERLFLTLLAAVTGSAIITTLRFSHPDM
jgi:hypothetical protein